MQEDRKSLFMLPSTYILRPKTLYEILSHTLYIKPTVFLFFSSYALIFQNGPEATEDNFLRAPIYEVDAFNSVSESKLLFFKEADTCDEVWQQYDTKYVD